MPDKPQSGSRRRFLLAASCTLGAAAAAPAVARAQVKPPEGMRIRTREEVGYQDEPYLGRTCAKCVLYQGHGKCVILSEAVAPTGWCKQWVPNTMG
jgi:hypothetical protein